MLLKLALVAVALAVAYPHTGPMYTAVSFVASVLLLLFTRPKPLPSKGWVFITGADSGMGEQCVYYLLKQGFNVFAGHFTPEVSAPKLRAKLIKMSDEDKTMAALSGDQKAAAWSSRCISVPYNSGSDESVAVAAGIVKDCLEKLRSVSKGGDPNESGLVGLCCCAGIGTTGAAEHFPIKMVKQCFEINYFGYYRSMQAFMPLLHSSSMRPGSRRGRIVFIGTGGGVPAPSPPLLSAYMGTKWAIEALCQTLRLECKLTRKRIDVCMLNPGFVQPTGLMQSGLDIIQQSFKDAPPSYKQEYEWMINNFVEFSKAPPITSPPLACAVAMHAALTDHTAKLRYCVGFDSKVSPIVGLLPTSWREALLSKQLYSKIPPPAEIKAREQLPY